MAPKRKPITTGKGPKSAPLVNPGRGPRPVSAKPSQAGLVRSAQKTTSSGITKRPDGRAQGEGRSGRQSISRATVTSASNGKPTGGSARVTRGKGSQLATVAKIASVAKGVSPATVAYETLKARPTADGTLTAAQSGRAPSRFANARDLAMKKASAIKGSPVVGPKKSAAGQFNSAFAAARKAGKKEFTWKGQKYTTKMK